MKFEESMLSGYLDNELTPEERVFVERHLESNPRDRETLSALSCIKERLSSLPQESFGASPVTAIRKRIAQQLAAPNVDGIHGADSTHSSAHPALLANATPSSLTAAKPALPNAQVPSHATKHHARTLWGSLALAAMVLIVVGYMASPPFRNVVVTSRDDAPSSMGKRAKTSDLNESSHSPDIDSADRPQSRLADPAGYSADPAGFSAALPDPHPVADDARGGQQDRLLEPPAAAMAAPGVEPANQPSRFLVYRAETGEWSVASEPTSNPADFLERSLVIDMPVKRVAGIIDWVADQLHSDRAPAASYQAALGVAPETLAIYVETDSSRAASLVQSLIEISKPSLDTITSPLTDSIAVAGSAGGQPAAGLAASKIVSSETNEINATQIGTESTTAAPAQYGTEAAHLNLHRRAGSPSIILGAEINQAVEQGKLWIIIRPVVENAEER
jgi:hypothetical protein